MARGNAKLDGAKGDASSESSLAKNTASKLVIAEDDESETMTTAETEGEGDDYTEYTDETETDSKSASEVTSSGEEEEEEEDEETENESVVTSSSMTDATEDDEEDDEDEDADADADEDEDEEEDEEDDQESDASSVHTTTTERGTNKLGLTLEKELSSAAIRENRRRDHVVQQDAPTDLEAAKTLVASSNRHDPLSPSVGAESMIDPQVIIQNPFGEGEPDKPPVLPKRPPSPRLTHLGAKFAAANEKAERINDSEYDSILARMVAQNRKLNKDPRAMRRSALGIGKLRLSFERLQQQQRKQVYSGQESEGLGTSSEEFGVGTALSKDAVRDTENDEEVDWEFWGGLINDYNTILTTSPVELSKAIYSGVPSVLRGMMWQLLSSSKDEELEAQYAKYLALPCAHERAIRRDLYRTFPGQEYFQDAHGIGQEHLFNVVKAYSLFDPECGYCQGMQFIVGPLLMNMPDEAAFSTLVRLMQNYDLRGHFIPNMPALQLRLYQFDRLVEDTLPLLHMHFVRRGVKSSMYASQWFMTLFSYRFPLEVVYRILDSIFAEGIDAVFRFAIALLHKSEAELIKLDFEDCLNFLKLHLIEQYTDTPAASKPHVRVSELMHDAFQVKIVPHTLDSYANEFYEQSRALNEHKVEMEALRLVNRNLRLKVHALEEQLHQVNDEHVALVKRVVMSKLSQEDMAEELVRYKVMYAEAVLQSEVQSERSRSSSFSAEASLS
ncbi:GTPase-activating protein [Malassezia vespertilionis]|uniref:Gyp5p n=1 Tax=Malassezia vespertilionis TaxID=2020962 RepID=A0A2N1J9E0_9BASI|nr:GTPase-activating protein [Malassezia vespertilionis]PKI83169.1 Gyp5p [Malassezia vespertilionis]WFD07697.1 GTPase-activating protein [Malassezia vespertilionis]